MPLLSRVKIQTVCAMQKTREVKDGRGETEPSTNESYARGRQMSLSLEHFDGNGLKTGLEIIHLQVRQRHQHCARLGVCDVLRNLSSFFFFQNKMAPRTAAQQKDAVKNFIATHASHKP